MRSVRAPLLAALLGLFLGAATAQDEPEPPAEPEAESPRAPEEQDAVDDVFIPSEEIQADEEVTFPVDI
jgi:hypothetical protein